MSRILVTRPATARPDALSAGLEEAGHRVLRVPTVEVTAVGDGRLEAALAADPPPAWLVVTSSHGARAVADRATGSRTPVPSGTRVAAVGSATAATLRAAGIRVDHVPDRFLTVAIAHGLDSVAGQWVVLARADAATPDLRLALEARGARVEDIVAYRTVEGPDASRDPLRAAIAAEPDAIAFTSGSTVRGAMALLAPALRPVATAVPAYCIGPVTARVARQNGFTVAAVATEHTGAGLADAISAHLAQPEPA